MGDAGYPVHMSRRREFAKLLPLDIRDEKGGAPVHLSTIYEAIERDYPGLVDDGVETSTDAVRWKHELRWELETLVGGAAVTRRKDFGRGIYSV